MQKEELQKHVDSGLSFSKIAKICGMTLPQVSTLAKKFNIKSKFEFSSAIKLPIDEIVKKYIDGVSMHSLGKEYNRPPHSLKKQILKQYPNLIIRNHDEAVQVEALNEENLKKWAKDGLSCTKIAKIVGCKVSTVLDSYKKFGINYHKEIYPIKDVLTKDVLYDLYINKQLSMPQIVNLYKDEYKISISIINNLLKKFKIASRPTKSDGSIYSYNLNDKDLLIEDYISNDMSMTDIANKYGCSPPNISYFLNKFSVKKDKNHIYNNLNIKNKKYELSNRFGNFKLDSKLELLFLNKMDNDDDITSIKSGDIIEYKGITYKPDFIVNNEYIAEVKSKERSLEPGVNRSRLIKQFIVSTKNNLKFKVWCGQFHDVNIENIDIYFSSNWKLNFDNSDDCYNWLVEFGYKDIEYNYDVLLNGINRYKEIINNSKNNLLSANISSSDTLALIKHFSNHLFKSKHKGYHSINEAWNNGNLSILKNALNEIWTKKNNVNIYGLIDKINKNCRDFAIVSIFKPWIAHFIYKNYVDENETVLDPCMGWGGRMIGLIDKNINYIGNDLNKNSYNSNIKLYEFIKSNINGSVSFINEDSTKFNFPRCDVIFTSPPYDDTEEYFGLNKNGTMADIINNISKIDAKKMILNIPKRSKELVIKTTVSNGWTLKEELKMITNAFISRNETYEPILIFEK